ncbi:unnamed protein product [marine sediment metagenome]|uniref:Uncharacterized protein n=1 Tax=marine sediment metagenome TaxID=412755 RepID=X1U8A7_9ZZZZ
MKREVIAIIILIITVICLIVLPRLYYHKGDPVDTIDLINAIYTATAVEIGLLGGLIISF